MILGYMNKTALTPLFDRTLVDINWSFAILRPSFSGEGFAWLLVFLFNDFQSQFCR